MEKRHVQTRKTMNNEQRLTDHCETGHIQDISAGVGLQTVAHFQTCLREGLWIHGGSLSRLECQ